MISIRCHQGDRYYATYYAHLNDAITARNWCYNNWGNDWGHVRFGLPNRLGFGTHDFFFKMMQHATWFKLRFDHV